MSSAYAPPPAQARSNLWVWLVGGCALAVIGSVAFVLFLWFLITAALRNSTPYKDTLARARNDARVIAALGAPVRTRFYLFGSVNVQNGSGDTNLNIPLRGPRGKASLHVAGTKERGRWSYSTMAVTLPDGTTINLLSDSEGSARTDPPDG